MVRQQIESFIDKNSGLKFFQSFVYIERNTCMLVERGGHIILFDTKYLDEIKRKRLSSGLLQKLKSRGFIENDLIELCDSVCSVKPEFFMIDITNQCNMRCKYCLRRIGVSDECVNRSTLIDICNFINEYCEDEKIQDVSIQPWGGEPLLELPDILMMREIIQPFYTKVHFSVETNGVLLNEEMIQTLYENKIGIGISIDGYAAVHDAQRVSVSGGGTHRVVERNLIMAKERYGSRLGTITTITKNNAAVIEDVLEYFACDLHLSDVKLNYVHESMFADCANLCLSNEEISEIELRILKKLIELNERGYNICEHNIKVKLKNLLYRQYSDICNSRGCLGGRKMVVFDRKGNIYPCELTDIPTESFGSIYDRLNLIPMINRAIAQSKYFTQKQSEKCAECEWYVFCGGGCTVRIMSKGNNSSGIDDVECAVNTVLYPALIELVLNKPEIAERMLNDEISK